MMVRYFTLCCLGLVAATVGAQPSRDADAYMRALYPNGPRMIRNEVTGIEEQPKFEIVTEVTLPEMHRRIAVYALRLDHELPLDKIYRVFVGVFEEHGDGLRAIDQHDVTEEMQLFVDFPGNFLDLDALVTPLLNHDSPLVAIELWARLSGTGFFTQADHLFFTLTGKGALEPLLTLPMTYASGRSGQQKNAKITSVFVSTAGEPELIVSRRTVLWEDYESDSPPQCSPPTLARYPLDGVTHEPSDAPMKVPPEGFMLLQRLGSEDAPICGH